MWQLDKLLQNVDTVGRMSRFLKTVHTDRASDIDQMLVKYDRIIDLNGPHDTLDSDAPQEF